MDLPDWAQNHILTVDQAARYLTEEGQQRLWTVVWTNGVFDIIHRAHVEFLRDAKRLGDILVVGVNNDESTRRIKGPGRPINCAMDRAMVLLAIKGVDLVVLFNEDEPAEPIRRLRPDIVVKGSSSHYDLPNTPEWPVVESYGGRMLEIRVIDGYSTTAIIDRARMLL